MLVGITAGRTLHLGALESLAAAAGFLALTTLARWHALARWWLPALAFVAAIGASLEAAARPSHRLRIEADPEEVLVVQGCVVESSSFFEGRAEFVVELEPGARAKVYQYPKNEQAPPALSYGDPVEFDARIRPPGSFDNPGAFDYPAYLARRQIYWIATMPNQAQVTRRPGECGDPLHRTIARTRAALLTRIEHFFPHNPYASGMLQALLLGDTTHVKRLWTEDFRRTGTFHALVISGQHVVVLTAGWVWVIFQITRRRWVAALAGVALAWVYAGLSGATAPVLRAAWGLTFYAGAGYFYRRGRVLNLLAAVVLVFIVLDPGQAVDASFQLSFLAVLAIGAFAIPVAEGTTGPFQQASRSLNNRAWDPSLPPLVAAIRVELRLLAETLWLITWIPERWATRLIAALVWIAATAGEMLLVTAMVQLALALPLVAYFHRFPVTGLLANLLTAPLLTPAIPAGMLAVVCNSSWLAGVAAWLVWASGEVVTWTVRWEPHWRIPAPPLWLGLLFLLTLAGLAGALRTRRWLLPASGLALATFAVVLWHPFAAQVRSGELELTAVDIGQGDGLLLVLPDGRTIGVDAGGLATFGKARTSGINTGEDIIAPYLWTRSIRRLDVLVLTHAHADHMGGLSALIDNFSPGEIWTGAMPAEEADWQKLARQKGIRVKGLTEGQRFRAAGVEFTILSPSPDRAPSPRAHNNDSLAMLVSYGRRAFLLTGDLEAGVERRLIEEWNLPHIDVLKVGHHGSRTSTTDEWLDALQPGVALISVGRENRYHHPHPQVMERLEARHITTLRTDELGLVTIRTNGHWLDFDSFRWREHGGSLLPAFEE